MSDEISEQPLDGIPALVLAAGIGTRLAPLTDHVPKPVIPVLGRPLVGYPLIHLYGAGCTQAHVNVFHRPERLMTTLDGWLQRRLLRMRVKYSVEAPHILGTGGALRKLEPALCDGGGPFLLLNGDSILGLDLPGLMSAHRSHRPSGTIATLLCRRHSQAESYGAVRVAADGRILDMAGLGRLPGVGDEELAAATPTVFCGVHVIEPEVVANLPPDGTESCIVRQGYAPLIAAGRDVRAVLAPDDMFFHDVGTPARYLDAQQALLRGELALPVAEGVDSFEALFQEASYAVDAQGREYGDPNTVQGLARAKLEPPVFFGPMNQVEPGASIGPDASLGLGCTVASGGRVVDSALWSFVDVGRGEALRGQLAAKLGDGIIRLNGRES